MKNQMNNNADLEQLLAKIQVPQDKMIPLTILNAIVRGIILSRGTCSPKEENSLPLSVCSLSGES